MPSALDHALTVVLAVLFPVSAATFGLRRLMRASPERLPQLRVSTYRRAIALQWTLTAAVFALWVTHHRLWGELGLIPKLNGGLIGCAVGLVVSAAFVLRQRAAVVNDGDSLRVVRRRLENVQVMMPRSVRELRWFCALSVTAGICEETLYRGYLIWYFQHYLGLVPAAAAAAVVFGIGHSYQGPMGVALTALVGAFLGAVYIVSRSLPIPMLLHALMDLHSGHLAYVAYAREALEARATAVFAPAPGGAALAAPHPGPGPAGGETMPPGAATGPAHVPAASGGSIAPAAAPPPEADDAPDA